MVLQLKLPSFAPCHDRWEHTRLRRRLMSGYWEGDLLARLSLLVGPERKQAWGAGDTTKNNFKAVVQQLATLFNRRHSIAHDVAEDAEAMSDLVDSAGWRELAIRHHQSVVALRESVVRVSVVEEHGKHRLLTRLVEPDLVHAEAPMGNPDVPNRITEWRVRSVKQPDGTYADDWTRDVLDLTDLDQPSYRVMSGDGEEDLTQEYLETDGEWPELFRDAEGLPVMPYVLYHAVRTGKLWDEREGMELVGGSLTIAVLWTYWNHIVRDCGHPQRAVANGQLAGAPRNVQEGVATIPEDPATILLFKAVRENAPIVFHQWAPGGDPEGLGRAIRDYAADLAVDYGINASDIERTHGNAQSGYAVQLSNNGKKEAQIAYLPAAMRGESQLYRVIATQWNRATGSTLAEDGYTAVLQVMGETPADRKQVVDYHLALKAAGLASTVDVYMALHGCSRPMALRELARVKTEDASLDSLVPAVGKAQDSALNGAQVTAALLIVERLVSKGLTLDMARRMLSQFFNIPEDKAAGLLAGAETLQETVNV